MANFLSPKIVIEETKDLDEIIALSKIVSQVFDFIIVTVGFKGVVTLKVADKLQDRNKTLIVNHYPVKALSQVDSVSGAGDCFASGFIHGMLLGYKEAQNVFIGFESSKQSLFCKNAVPYNLCIAANLIKVAECMSIKVKCN